MPTWVFSKYEIEKYKSNNPYLKRSIMKNMFIFYFLNS